MIICGDIKVIDLGPGVVQLCADDGRTYTLRGRDLNRFDGMRVEVTGAVAESVGFSMMGDTSIAVETIKPVK